MPEDKVLTTRPQWDEYFLKMAELAATRSTCMRRKVGCVLVRDRQVLSTGYNGAPTGCSHCDATGCLRQQLNVPSGQRHELCRGSHAEMNAIAQAAKAGIRLEGCTCYCTLKPCSMCTKLLINAGCRKIVVIDPGYNDELTDNLIREAGIELLVK